MRARLNPDVWPGLPLLPVSRSPLSRARRGLGFDPLIGGKGLSDVVLFAEPAIGIEHLSEREVQDICDALEKEAGPGIGPARKTATADPDTQRMFRARLA